VQRTSWPLPGRRDAALGAAVRWHRGHAVSNAFNYAQPPRQPVRMVQRPLPPSAKRIHLTPALVNDPT
jgi:hypothetical protein